MSNSERLIQILPHGRQIKATTGMSLLEALMQQSIFLRSDCGGLEGGLYYPWDKDEKVAQKVLHIENIKKYKAPFITRQFQPPGDNIP